MKDNKLEVGDEVYRERTSISNVLNYEILKVMKVTKTTAILNNNIKLQRESHNSFSNTKRWSVIPHRTYTSYELLTEEIRAKIAESKILYTKLSWFNNKQFTDEEKIQIYDLLNK